MVSFFFFFSVFMVGTFCAFLLDGVGKNWLGNLDIFFWMAGTLSFLYVICSGTQIVSWFFDPAWGLGYVLSR